MKPRHVPIAGLAVLASSIAFPRSAAAADNDEILLLSFFRDNGQAGIFLAASEDGLQFKPLNDDKPVMKPAAWAGQVLTRDPSIVFHEGRFHAVWTTSWKGDCFGYAESKDLVAWSEPVQVRPYPASLTPRNTWAPEICRDPGRGDFLIAWSATVGPRGQQIFVTRTADGKSFAEARLFLDRPFGCIDGMLALDDRAVPPRWVMVYKNEEAVEKGGKNLHIATAPADLSQPWSPGPRPIVGPGTAVRPHEMAEGPSLLKWKGAWYLYWDAFANKHYSMASSSDLTNWTDRTADLQMPPHPRHGTVFRAPRSAVGWLRNPPAARMP
jgi:hypothetical protein